MRFQLISMAIITQSLYDYQEQAVKKLRDFIRYGNKRLLLVAPTGSGKGTLATHMVTRAAERGKNVLFLVNRRELVKDTSRRLDRLGLDHGIIMAGTDRRKPWLNVHVASIDTLNRREVVPPADLIFADEAHFSVSPTWQKVLDKYFGVPVIGMTATPIRADGRGLGEMYEVLIPGPSVAELTQRGFLVPARIFAPAAPDLSGVTIKDGEYNQKQVAKVLDRPKLIGDIVSHWMRLGRGRPTVCFGVNVEHSKHIVAQFEAAGVRAVHVDANTPDDATEQHIGREKTWAGLADGSIEVCCSVGIISYGWDVPPVSCAILARSTKSLALYLQQVGRVLRTHPSKTDALILDHAGACLEHGFPDDEREWTLEGLRKKPKLPSDAVQCVRMCRACFLAYPSTRDKCPECGEPYEVRDTVPEFTAGELQEMTAENRPAYTIRKLSKNPRIAELQQTAAEKGYKPGWVFMQARKMGLSLGGAR